MLSRDKKKSINNDVTKRRTRNTNCRNSDSSLYCEHNTSRISLSSCIDAILVIYIKVQQILNQMVDLMLRIVWHVPRVSHMTGIFTQLWRQCHWCPPNANFGGRVPLSPAGFTPLLTRRAAAFKRRCNLSVAARGRQQHIKPYFDDV